MQRTVFSAIFLALLALAWNAGFAPAPIEADSHATSGQGKYKFKVAYKGSHLPSEAQAVLEKAHGGFAIDRRDGKGEVYFALPGAGIIQVSSDLSKTKMLATDDAMKPHNMHNATIWYDSDGKAHLSFPGNGNATVFTTDLEGKLEHELKSPDGTSDLGYPTATDYFFGRGNFVPTDVEQLGDLFYVATGYSSLDYVITAKIKSTNPFKVSWYDLAFGGKGSGPGQFGTGHGITVPIGTQRVDVADRPNAEIDRFTRHGQYISTLKLPLGSYPCDVGLPRQSWRCRSSPRAGPPARGTDLHPRRRQARIDDPAEGRTRSRKIPARAQRCPAQGEWQAVCDRAGVEPGRLRGLRAGHVSNPAIPEGELVAGPGARGPGLWRTASPWSMPCPNR